MPFTIELDDARALVTGAGRGVGRGISLALASAGACVLVNDHAADRAEAVAAEIRSAGGTADALPFDVSDFDAVNTAMSGAGPVGILVNNAGNAGLSEYLFGSFVDSQPSDWDRYFSANLFGVMYCTRAVLPAMVERSNGRVITIVSESGRWGDAQMAAYSAAKAGAAGFTRALARDVGRYGITVNNVSLGTIDTMGITEAAAESPEQAERLQRQLKSYIIRRLGRPDDVAGIVTFLASPMASWITGQTYPVNGGFTVNQ